MLHNKASIFFINKSKNEIDTYLNNFRTKLSLS
jgi:hypothetical protein